MVFSGPSTLRARHSAARLVISPTDSVPSGCDSSPQDCNRGRSFRPASPVPGPAHLPNRRKPVRLSVVVAKRIVLFVKAVKARFYHRRSGETGTDQHAVPDLLTRPAVGQFSVRDPSIVRLLQQLRRPAGLPN